MTKVLFIVPYTREAASSRYRVYQYLPYLRSHGILPTVRPFVDSDRFYSLLHRPGHLALKTLYTLRGLARRGLDLLHVQDHHLVFIQREAAPLGPALFEPLASRSQPIVFDFDDAVYLPHVSLANGWLERLKNAEKTAEAIRLSAQVVAGNETLAGYARRHNPHVSVIPTVVDTNALPLRPERRNAGDPLTIGWIGGHTTIQYLRQLEPVFRALAHRYPLKVRVVGAPYALPGVQVEWVPWSLASEVAELHSFDIGVMPMPDDPWTRGKCGLKALQYQAVGVPAVASPVGVNTRIIRHGESGFLATTEAEWVDSLSMLIEDPALRWQMGRAGRDWVEAEYSLQTAAPQMLAVLSWVSGGGLRS